MNNLSLQEMVSFSKKVPDWKPTEHTKEMPYSFKGSLNGLDVFIHLGHGAMMPFFEIGVYNGSNQVGSEICSIPEEDPVGVPNPNKKLIDFYSNIKDSYEQIGRSQQPKRQYFKKHLNQDIKRVRKIIR